MWLLPAFSWISRRAAHFYYRLQVSGATIPHAGPLLLVANHPNALLDPMLVAAAARRPVRFLAKAPLFETFGLGRLVRAVGSIPVYRRSDDPAATAQNLDTFRSVYDALGQGAAIGIFPEGISHSESALAPLKTGAARIALGTFARHGRVFPIVPVGLILRRKEIFRSPGAVIVGQPIEWSDLAGRGPEDARAVHELMDRLEAGLRRVTLNLERWQDRPLVECAEAMWTAERGADRDPAATVRRLAVTTELLDRLRRQPRLESGSLMLDVGAHCRRLKLLGLRPADLHVAIGLRTTLRWLVARAHLGLASAIAVAGFLVFWPPFRLTGWIARIAAPDPVLRSTVQFAVGSVTYSAWILLLAVLALAGIGPAGAIAAIVVLPALGVAALWIGERLGRALADIRRYFTLRSRRGLVDDLRARQRELVERLARLVARPPR